MNRLLQAAGVQEGHILTEAESKTTLQSLIKCTRIIQRERLSGPVVVCSDVYHIPRCRLILCLLGIRTVFRPMPSGREVNGVLRWASYYIRDAAAIPYNLLTLLFLKATRKA